jgi:hypothetical protein
VSWSNRLLSASSGSAFASRVHSQPFTNRSNIEPMHQGRWLILATIGSLLRLAALFVYRQ